MSVTMPDDHRTPSVRGKVSEPRFGCPYCGSDDIEEANLMTVMYEITAWDDDGFPADYGIMRETDVIERDEPPYWCRRCLKEFTEPKSLGQQR